MPNGILQIFQHLLIQTKIDESVLTVESTGALSPEQILLAGVEEVGTD